MKAQKKPVIIDCILYTGNIQDVINFVESFSQNFDEHFNLDIRANNNSKLSVKTLEGSSYDLIADKHVIIRGVRGEFYPCELSIFQETYELI